MSREAEMIETYVRGLEAGRQSALAVAGGRCVVKAALLIKKKTNHQHFRADLPMGGGGGYGSAPSCYRCNG